MNIFFILNVISIVLIVIAVIAGLLYLLHFLRYRSGRLAQIKVANALKKFGVIRNYKVLENLSLRYGNHEAQIDCMLTVSYTHLTLPTNREV